MDGDGKWTVTVTVMVTVRNGNGKGRLGTVTERSGKHFINERFTVI
jgi:hypothetical protein